MTFKDLFNIKKWQQKRYSNLKIIKIPSWKLRYNINYTAMFKLDILCAKGLVHNTPEKLENGDFTLKKHQMFSIYITKRNIHRRQKILNAALRVRVNQVIITMWSFSKTKPLFSKLDFVQIKTQARCFKIPPV